MKKTTKAPKADKKFSLTVNYNNESQTITGDTIEDALRSFVPPVVFKSDVDVHCGGKTHVMNIRKARQVFGGNRNALAVFAVALNRRLNG